MSGLLDFLQSASNTAASTVSGPVDLIGMLLRKAGVPVPQDSLGSSEWMKQKGLMQDVPQSAASLAGETFGLLSPVVAAAKAPQIAGGLLKMGENAAAPRTLNPQTGAIVWHGSPHKFDKFDSSKIGTGEGAQAYGHGLYLAESPDVAGSYLRAGRNVGFENWDDPLRLADKAFAQASGNKQKAIELLDDAISASKRGKRQDNLIFAKRALERGDESSGLYKVDLPDPMIARMLDWDKPLSQQRGVMDALYDSPVGRGGYANGAMGERRFVQPLQAHRTGAAMLEDLRLLTGPTKAEETLRRAGIPGIRYLDGGSRGAGSGTSNFVVFPGEENLLKILERNGIPMQLP